MLRLAFVIIILVLPSGALCEGRQPGGSLGVDLNSAYVFRGAALSTAAVAQPYFEVGVPALPGFTLGTWGSIDLESNAAGTADSGHFSEVDYYGLFELPLNSDTFNLTLAYTEYVFVHFDSFREAGVNLEIDTLLSPALSAFYAFDGEFDEQTYLEFSLGHRSEPADDAELSLTAALGYVFQPRASVAADGFSHLTVTAAGSWGFLNASVNYVHETDAQVQAVAEDFWWGVGLSYSF